MISRCNGCDFAPSVLPPSGTVSILGMPAQTPPAPATLAVTALPQAVPTGGCAGCGCGGACADKWKVLLAVAVVLLVLRGA